MQGCRFCEISPSQTNWLSLPVREEVYLRDFLSTAHCPLLTGQRHRSLSKSPVYGLIRHRYTARFVKPGETLGMHLYNYVYVDGTFRLAGKMDAVKG